MRQSVRLALAAALCAVSSAAAIAQNNYPTKPVRLIVPFPPGGSTDIIARLVGQKLGERLGQEIVIDNRGGAGGTIGTEIAVRANPDGYTLTMGTTGTHAIAAGLYSKLQYDPIDDFAPLTLVASTPYLLVVNPGVKANSLKEFVALVKSQPGKLTFASAGTGNTTQLAMEMLKLAAGIEIVHMPYNGGRAAITPTLAGQVQALFISVPEVLVHAKAGTLRPLAVSTAKRSPSLPDVPTVAESGYPGFEVSLWVGFFAPKGTPAPILNRLHGELVKIAQSPEMKNQFEKNGAEAVTNSRGELTHLVRSDINKYTKVIKAAGVQPQ
jgi:tripartite-type tricarboxylate transporter receptor subunit TctC